MGKILGIGLSKTGTTSLAKALEMLGYKSIHAEGVHHIEKYEASTDVPVAARYKQLDRLYSNSKFILTVRDLESWLESCRRHWENNNPYYLSNVMLAAEYAFCRGVLFGIDHFDPDEFRSAYQRHLEGVRRYFRNRPQDLLEMNIVAGEGFEKLCPFLGKPVLQASFPKANEYKPRDPQDSTRASQAEAAGRGVKPKSIREHFRRAVSFPEWKR